MSKKLLFVGMILVLMVSFSVVLADQDGNARWCNSDQYGCWVTGEDGGQCYIMFWSESARELFMGPGSKAPLGDPFPAGKMTLPKPPVAGGTLYCPKGFSKCLTQAQLDAELAECSKQTGGQCYWDESAQTIRVVVSDKVID